VNELESSNESDFGPALVEISKLWWLVLLRGVLLIALGVYALTAPGLTAVIFTQVLAVFVLLDGLVAIVAGAIGWAEARVWTIVRGLIAILAAAFVIAHPLVMGVLAATVLLIIFAVQWIIGGMVEIAVGVRQRKEIDGEWWLIIGGVLSIVFGALLLASPILAGMVLIQVLGVFAIVFGVLLVVASFRVRSMGKKPNEAS